MVIILVSSQFAPLNRANEYFFQFLLAPNRLFSYFFLCIFSYTNRIGYWKVWSNWRFWLAENGIFRWPFLPLPSSQITIFRSCTIWSHLFTRAMYMFVLRKACMVFPKQAVLRMNTENNTRIYWLGQPFLLLYDSVVSCKKGSILSSNFISSKRY